MFIKNYGKRPIVENCQIITISNLVREALLERDTNDKRIFSAVITTEEEAKKMVDYLENYVNIQLSQEVNKEQVYGNKNTLLINYTPSNLGKGFIFWFLCNGCIKKVRNLYFPPSSDELLCRNCHRLSYRKQNRTKNHLRGYLYRKGLS